MKEQIKEISLKDVIDYLENDADNLGDAIMHFKWMRDNHLPSKGEPQDPIVEFISEGIKDGAKQIEPPQTEKKSSYPETVDQLRGNRVVTSAPSKGDDYTKSLEDCGNKILDSVDKNETPVRAIMGLRILLNRPYQKQALKTKGGEDE